MLILCEADWPRPVADSLFPLREAAAAQRRRDLAWQLSKVLLTPRPPE